jgi:hypothetical protein
LLLQGNNKNQSTHSPKPSADMNPDPGLLPAHIVLAPEQVPMLKVTFHSLDIFRLRYQLRNNVMPGHPGLFLGYL